MYAADICEYEWQGEERLRDLLAIQVIIELNVAFCERHLVNCPPSEQLQKECTYVSSASLVLFVLLLLLLFGPESLSREREGIFLASFGKDC